MTTVKATRIWYVSLERLTQYGPWQVPTLHSPHSPVLTLDTNVLGPMQMFSHMQILKMASDLPLPVVFSAQNKIQ